MLEFSDVPLVKGIRDFLAKVCNFFSLMLANLLCHKSSEESLSIAFIA